MRRHQDTLPIVRPWPHLLRHLVTGANPLPALCALQQRHGDAYILDLGLTRLWVLMRPEHAQHILQHNAHNYRKGDHFETPLRAVIGNGSAAFPTGGKKLDNEASNRQVDTNRYIAVRV